jgi:uncharacterized protein YjbI with pentapeptide repeats
MDMQRPGYAKRSSGIHRRVYIVLEMAEGNEIPTEAQEKEPGKRPPWWKRLRGRGSKKRTRQRKSWTLREFWGKTVWDWMQLLIVPVAILLITVAFTWQQNKRQEAIEEQRAQDLALQGYLDQMGTLMLEDLSDPKVRTIMQARTLSVLKRLDTSRKAEVVQFLSVASLISSEGDTDPVIEINEANLAHTDLSRSNFRNADLGGAELVGANLGAADLAGADLGYADLTNANLAMANLRDAYLKDTDLDGSNLFNASLERANLNYANLSNANLKAAHCEGANLESANMEGANISPGTNLRDTNLTRVYVRSTKQLTDTTALEGATMPNGQKYEDWLKSKGRGQDGE